MRIAICGLGLRANHVLSLMKSNMPEIEFVGFLDPKAQPPFLVGGPDMPKFDDLNKMLTATTPDLLFVASPNHMHLEHIRIGLEAGVRIFAEKPVVTTIDDTFALAELLAKHGTDSVIIGLVLRYSQHMRDLGAALDADQIGDIASIEASEYIEPEHGAFFMRDWRRHSKYSGGFMLEKCCHDLDVYNMITGSRPARVASFGGRRSFLPKHAPGNGVDDAVYNRKASTWESQDDAFKADGDVVDHQTAIIEYESGANMTFHTNVNVPDEHRRFCVMGAKGMAEGDFVRGYLRVTDARTSERLQDIDYSENTELQGAHYGADELMCKDIVAHLRGNNEKLPVGVVDALTAGITAMAIDEARKTGTVVDLSPYWEKFDSYNLH
ncbi:MAG: Gfo/Idh/MocA family oxidoreductase [Paracoccaceae bacterium]